MAKFWNRWKNRTGESHWGESHWGDSREHNWQYRDEDVDYGWLKRTVVSILVFSLVYIAHVSETAVGRVVDDGVRYMLTTETDVAYIADRLAQYAPQGFDTAVLKRVQTTVSKPADPLLYMSKPVEGKIAAPFGWRTHPVLKQEMMHEGLDIEAALGTSVRASAPGKVKLVNESAQYGRTVIIEHGQEVETMYGHLGEVLVKSGDMVSQGQIIARVGKTGITNTPQLYFEVREKGNAVDPMTRIKGDFPAKEGK